MEKLDIALLGLGVMGQNLALNMDRNGWKVGVWNRHSFGPHDKLTEFITTKAKGTWKDHAIPDVWKEDVGKSHAHEKPYELQKRLIESTTNAGDIVLDPAAGSYSVFKACRALNIDFIGGDIECFF